MKKNFIILVVLSLYGLGVLYLVQPSPTLPDLGGSSRSDEPGDTWQHPDQKAFYTTRTNRSEILGELQQKFALPSIWKNLSYRLNYPPEEAFTLVRDQLRSYYLEEVTHPLRESLFINVLDPEKSPLIQDEDRKQARMFLHGQFFPIKVTLRPVYSPLWGRLLIWTMVFPSLFLVYLSLDKSIHEK